MDENEENKSEPETDTNEELGSESDEIDENESTETAEKSSEV